MSDSELVVRLQTHIEIMDNLIKNHKTPGFKHNCKLVYNDIIKRVRKLAKITLLESNIDGLDNVVNRIADVINQEFELIKSEVKEK